MNLPHSDLHVSQGRTLYPFCTPREGLRISEAIALDDNDIETREGMLIVRQDKAQSFRLVPLHPTTLDALAGYQRRRDHLLPARTTPALLVSRTGGRLTYNSIHKTFTRLVTAAGLGPRTGRCRPRIHALRHTFAVNSLAGFLSAVAVSTVSGVSYAQGCGRCRNVAPSAG